MTQLNPDAYDKATIERVRAAVQAQVDKLHRWERESEAKEEDDRAERCKFAAWWLESQILGEGGCVITTLDTRWLDDDFRTNMLNVGVA